MGVRLVPEGVEFRPLLGRPRLVRFDDLESESLPPHIAQQVAPVLKGPALEGSALAAYLAGPHGPRIAARALLATAEKLNATDIHLEPTTDGGTIRLRREGELTPLCAVPATAWPSFVAALKGLAGCLPYRSDLVQEGRIAREGVGADIRASFVPAAFGERVALRLFGRLRQLPELGLPVETLTALERLLTSRTGLLLVAGATGAGKTTTLYAALAHLATIRPGAHLSLEDPIEQRLRLAGIAVDQVELRPERGVTGESMLIAALRQDIDVLGVGEIRTEAEASLALKAAHTGRLVLAGVHAGSCEEAQQRMLDLGVEPRLLQQTLRGVLHQELAVEPCGCTSPAGCERCHGLGRRRRLRAQLLSCAPRLEVVA
jgi:type II secretory ATPase GspE/PulE/Tfp pilus assembly ATPase PilB-like protein